MNYTEIHVNNPINFKSINKLMDDIKSSNSSLLIINIEAHNFESIEVIKDIKNRLNLEKDILSSFRKIAFLHPPDFRNKSEDEERYNYFSSKQEAVSWLEKL